MRRALGLFGAGMRHRPDSERSDAPPRTAERFNPAMHRRRFVQDGDIPVTVVRRDNGVDPAAGPSSSRLQRTEAALAAETAARAQAERALAEAGAQNRELQTKYGHAELIRVEATDALKRERDTIITLREAVESLQVQVRDAEERSAATGAALEQTREALAHERSARKTAERAMRDAISTRQDAEQMLAEQLALPEPVPPPPPVAPRAVVSRATPVAKPAPARVVETRRAPPAPAVAEDPEPVKWWLNPNAAGKRR